MKLLRHKLFLFIAVLAVLAGCKKAEFDNAMTGEVVGDFTVLSPTTAGTVALNAATPNESMVIRWNPSKPGVSAPVRYKWIASLKSENNFEAGKRYLELPSDSNGLRPQLTLTYKMLDDALKAKGVADGATVELLWTVEASNEFNGTALAGGPYALTVRRMADGASPFQLLGPVSSASTVAIDPGSTGNAFHFNWTRSAPAVAASYVQYKVLFAERKTDASGAVLPVDWSAPLFSIAADNNGADTVATVSYKNLSDSLTKYGFTDLGAASSLLWTVVATSGTWNQYSDYVNNLAVLREVRLFMPGSFQNALGYGNDWTPATAPELVRDTRNGLINNLYYTYIWLPAGTEFKITQGRAWDVNYGGSNGNLEPGGANFKVNNAGVYRISVNRTTMKYDIREGRMGFVGDATGSGWNPPNVFPNNAMGYAAPNLFVGIHNFNPGGWKLIDNNEWNNGSNSVEETRSYGAAGGSGSSLETNGPNMPNMSGAGAYRVIWDGRDVNNVKYELSAADEMRIVGDGMSGVNAWDPGASPKMTYKGNGKWEATLSLLADKDIKFLAGAAWGAFDYEDGGDAGGGKRKIRWEGGNNFKTPGTAGTYTIILDEHTQTVTFQ
ncbi:MAG TPA: SusF/SusE family outer membrane protein [Chitinophagaceae bacterium]|jgi:hypothetical protein|nr:SusF/SusE family outer membrane protein [Chitinophagaceae bacterium]